jgi:glyoxylase-like metal-dependent hydrolase (beta-lactamase superfamily II)
MRDMRKSAITLFFFFAVLVSYRRPGGFSSRHFTIQLLSPGVWAAISNDNYGHAICNAGIIDLGDKTVVFDPFMNIDAAKDLKAAAMELTKKTVTIVVNSHYHNDHIRGNQVFVPGASIISTGWTRNEMSISEPEEIAWEKQNVAKRLADLKEKLKTAQGMEKKELPMWIGYYGAMVINDPALKTTLPDITFHDSLWIYGKRTNIKLVECKNGHTESDLILMLPKEGIVFMGDLFFVKRHPYLGDGSPQSLMGHLQRMEEDKTYSAYVPGHGPLGGKEEVNELINYIKAVTQLVRQDIDKSMPDSVIVKESVPGPYKDWWFGRFYKPNLEFLCGELRKK